MRITSIVAGMLVGWAVLFWGGNLAVDRLTADVDVAAVAAERQSLVAERALNHCFMRNYRIDATGRATSLAQMTVPCAAEAEGVSTGLIKAGVVAPVAEARVRSMARETHRKMLRLMPPCPSGEPMRHMS